MHRAIEVKEDDVMDVEGNENIQKMNSNEDFVKSVTLRPHANVVFYEMKYSTAFVHANRPEKGSC